MKKIKEVALHILLFSLVVLVMQTLFDKLDKHEAKVEDDPKERHYSVGESLVEMNSCFNIIVPLWIDQTQDENGGLVLIKDLEDDQGERLIFNCENEVPDVMSYIEIDNSLKVYRQLQTLPSPIQVTINDIPAYKLSFQASQLYKGKIRSFIIHKYYILYESKLIAISEYQYSDSNQSKMQPVFQKIIDSIALIK
jgi:hypothetical protein